jgi:CubicO group peptidase (beta-lactamase class C family)
MNRSRHAALILGLVSTMFVISTRAATAAPPWLDSEYLHRYFFWGAHHLADTSDDYKLFPYHEVQNAPPAFHFVSGDPAAMPSTVKYHDGDTLKQAALEDLLASTGTHAFIVVRNDKILYEKYFNGYQRDSICLSRSMAKSFVSALVGIAIDEGLIRGVNEHITNYLPELKGRGFDPITIRNLLTMDSGIQFRFGDFPWTEETLDYFYPNLTYWLLNDLVIVEPPGHTFHYADLDTELLAVILRRATKRTLAEYLQEKIWKPLGMEYPATWSIDSEQDGLEMAFVLLNARAIDYAKFGRLYLNHGNWNGAQLVPEKWVTESTTPDADDRRSWETYSDFRNAGGYYKYQWWGHQSADGYTYQAQGLWGQYIVVSPKNKVVIVRTGSKWGIDAGSWQQILRYLTSRIAPE